MKIYLFLFLLFALSCSKDTELESNQIITSRTTYTLSGKIFWSKDLVSGVGNVTVNLSGPETSFFTTTSDGLFSFTVSTEGEYTITPSKTINVMNGVTTSDPVWINNYLFYQFPLTAHQVVAADANKNNNVSTADVSLILQAALGNPAARLAISPSWTFVDKDYEFLVLAPIPDYPKNITVFVNQDISNLDFVGIKRCDVNNTCNPNL